mgnify:CR=1 FL=1
MAAAAEAAAAARRRGCHRRHPRQLQAARESEVWELAAAAMAAAWEAAASAARPRVMATPQLAAAACLSSCKDSKGRKEHNGYSRRCLVNNSGDPMLGNQLSKYAPATHR